MIWIILLPIITLLLSIAGIAKETNKKWKFYLISLIMISSLITIIQNIKTENKNNLIKNQIEIITYSQSISKERVDYIVDIIKDEIRKKNFALTRSSVYKNGDILMEFVAINENVNDGLLYLTQKEIIELSLLNDKSLKKKINKLSFEKWIFKDNIFEISNENQFQKLISDLVDGTAIRIEEVNENGVKYMLISYTKDNGDFNESIKVSYSELTGILNRERIISSHLLSLLISEKLNANQKISFKRN